ncbi:hypothetical protein [Methylomonas koyamae]|nr:hypothetical protein [Methylomonas koyamae]WNB76755.1 hypothetical protein RI210_04060 [Methylomonas koyamae]
MTPEQIIACCEKHWDADKLNCSGFLKAAADDLGANLQGNASEISTFI